MLAFGLLNMVSATPATSNAPLLQQLQQQGVITNSFAAQLSAPDSSLLNMDLIKAREKEFSSILVGQPTSSSLAPAVEASPSKPNRAKTTGNTSFFKQLPYAISMGKSLTSNGPIIMKASQQIAMRRAGGMINQVMSSAAREESSSTSTVSFTTTTSSSSSSTVTTVSTSSSSPASAPSSTPSSAVGSASNSPYSTFPPAAAASQQSSAGQSSQISPHAFIGIVCAGLIGVFAIVGAVLYYIRRGKGNVDRSSDSLKSLEEVDSIPPAPPVEYASVALPAFEETLSTSPVSNIYGSFIMPLKEYHSINDVTTDSCDQDGSSFAARSRRESDYAPSYHPEEAHSPVALEPPASTLPVVAQALRPLPPHEQQRVHMPVANNDDFRISVVSQTESSIDNSSIVYSNEFRFD